MGETIFAFIKKNKPNDAFRHTSWENIQVSLLKSLQDVNWLHTFYFKCPINNKKKHKAVPKTLPWGIPNFKEARNYFYNRECLGKILN